MQQNHPTDSLSLSSPSQIIQMYFGISLNDTSKYLHVHVEDKTYQLGVKSFTNIDIDSVERKNIKQNHLLQKVIKHLLENRDLKPLSQILPNIENSNVSACFSSKERDNNPNPIKIDVFDQYLASIDQKEKSLLKVDIIIAIFVERIFQSGIDKISERYHRNILANALEWHRQNYFGQFRPNCTLTPELLFEDKEDKEDYFLSDLSKTEDRSLKKAGPPLIGTQAKTKPIEIVLPKKIVHFDSYFSSKTSSDPSSSLSRPPSNPSLPPHRSDSNSSHSRRKNSNPIQISSDLSPSPRHSDSIFPSSKQGNLSLRLRRVSNDSTSLRGSVIESSPASTSSSPRHREVNSLSPRHREATSLSPRRSNSGSKERSSPITSNSPPIISKSLWTNGSDSDPTHSSSPSQSPRFDSTTSLQFYSEINFYELMLKNLSCDGLEYCQRWCKYQFTKDQNDADLMKDTKDKLKTNDNSKDCPIIRQKGFLNMAMMRYVVQESLSRGIHHNISLDRLSEDIERNLEYISVIDSHGGNLFNFSPLQVPQIEHRDQTAFYHKNSQFKALLKILVTAMKESDESFYSILGMWEGCVYQESRANVNNETFANACKLFLHDLKASLLYKDKQTDVYQIYSLLIGFSQDTYVFPSLLLTQTFKTLELKQVNRSIQYKVTPTEVNLSCKVILESFSTAFAHFKILLLNKLTLNSSNLELWTSNISFEIIPVVSISESNKLTILGTPNSKKISTISSDTLQQIYKMILMPLRNFGFNAIMKKDSLDMPCSYLTDISKK